MALSLIELSDLEEDIMNQFPDKVTAILSKLNRTDKLEEWLSMMDMSDLLKGNNTVESFKEGKIVVIGGTEVKENILLGIAKKLGLDKSRFEFCLDYKKIQKYDYKKLQHNPNYRVILVGPSPHSGRGKGTSSSTITAIEQGKYYPPVIRLQGSNGLKITKTNFRETLEQLIEDGFI